MIYNAETTDVEVTHQKYGRGRVVEVVIGQEDEVDLADVYFYTDDEFRTVPLTTLLPAASVATTNVVSGDNGLEVVVDDGFFELIITADGDGTGFDVSMKAGKATVDTSHLSYESFL